MADYEAIYDHQADAYDRMVRAEDCEGNLLRALAALVELDGARALEVGVGTGRIDRELARRGF